MLREAVEHLERALMLNEAIAHTLAQAVNLGNLSCLYLEVGRLHDAEASLNRSLALCRELEHRASEANGLVIMGKVLHGVDRLPEARDTLLPAGHDRGVMCQMVFPASSATSRRPFLPVITPTGRPYVVLSSGAGLNPVRKSWGLALGMPFLKGTYTTL